VQALAASPVLAHVTHLNLYHNRISAAGARALASSPRPAHLLTLHLSGNRIGAAAARGPAPPPLLEKRRGSREGGGGPGGAGVAGTVRPRRRRRLNRHAARWRCRVGRGPRRPRNPGGRHPPLARQRADVGSTISLGGSMRKAARDLPGGQTDGGERA